jgi:predicted transcriptional regulator
MLQMEEKPRQKLCTLLLSYNQLKEYLSILIENNLIEYLDGTQTYKTTEKGLNLLKMHNEMAELLYTTLKND